VRVVGTTELVSCARCGEAAEPITVHRAELRSYAARLPGVWVGLFTTGGLLTLVGAAVVMWALGHAGFIGKLLRLGVFWGLVFAAVRQASRGESGVEAPDLSDLFHDVARPALMGILATSIVWVPAVAWVFARPDGPSGPIASDPVLWLIALASVLYAPMAILHAAMGGSALHMLNPVGIGVAAFRLGRDYLVAVGASALLAVGSGVVAVAGAVAFGDIPVVSGVLAELVGLVAPLLLARSLGLLLHVRGDAIGLGVPQDYLEPVLPGAAPRGSPPARAAPEQGAEPGPAAGAATRIEAIEMDLPGPDPATEAARIAGDVGRGDLASAARRYAALPAPPAGLPAAVLFQVARGAAGAGNFLSAARALQAAARSGDPAVAPDALLVLARICLQRLNRPADARTVLNHLVARYPESAAARHGQKLLAEAGAA
jgi:hypothetical protein